MVLELASLLSTRIPTEDAANEGGTPAAALVEADSPDVVVSYQLVYQSKLLGVEHRGLVGSRAVRGASDCTHHARVEI